MNPPKLVKIAASVLCQPLSNAGNNSLSKVIFPGESKITMVSPLGKVTSNKNDISNFRPVSILTTFSKIYERVTKLGSVFMGLSKAFNCIPHDLLIAKLKAYGFDEYLVHYLYSYLDNRKQCARINNEKSSSQNIISGVPQSSIVGPTLFNLFLTIFIVYFNCIGS